MPKDNPVLEEIGKLYKNNTFNLLIYGFITGVQWSLPSLTTKEAAEMFLKRYKIAKKTMTVETVLTTFSRINHDMLNEERRQE